MKNVDMNIIKNKKFVIREELKLISDKHGSTINNNIQLV